jgi:hypothetical protein
MICDHFNNNGDFERVAGRKLTDDEARFIHVAYSQSEIIEALYKQAVLIDPPYANDLYTKFLAGGHDPDNLIKNAFPQIIAQGKSEPAVPLPVPDGGLAPQQTGFVTPKVPGPIFMSSLPMPDGLLIGTYRPARILRFDGAIHEELATGAESFYFPWMCPDGQPIWTTECDHAAIYGRDFEGDWCKHNTSPLENALTFEPYRIGDNLYCWRPDYAGATSGTIIKGDVNGLNWTPYRTLSGKQLLNMGSDGNTLRLVGNMNGYPIVTDDTGKVIYKREEYADNTYAYCIGNNGVWNFGANSLSEKTDHRRAYIDVWDGNLHSVCDLDRPWVMDMQVFDGHRYALSSVWNETDHQTAQLHRSDGGQKWEHVCDIPMPSAISMSFVPGGVYISGGLYGQWGAVYFVKLEDAA